MGWFATDPDTSGHAKKNTEGAFADAPDRTTRAQCWEARDAFFRCLDQHSILDAVQEDKAAREKCAKDLADFERDCASSWVHYFKKRRVMEFRKAETLKRLEAEGAQGIPLDSRPGS